MKQCLLNNVYGGSNTQIKDISGLLKALKEDESLTKEVMEVLQDDKVASLLRNKEKVNKIINLYNRIEPGFRDRIPQYLQKLEMFGYL
jgi:hypothetical protein